MARVGAQIILNALFVADINENVLEDTAVGTFADGYAQTALQHVLQQSGGLQTHRLSTRIRS